MLDQISGVSKFVAAPVEDVRTDYLKAQSIGLQNALERDPSSTENVLVMEAFSREMQRMDECHKGNGDIIAPIESAGPDLTRMYVLLPPVPYPSISSAAIVFSKGRSTHALTCSI